MKVLLLIPSFYTLGSTIKKGFEDLGYTVRQYDYRLDLAQIKNKINVQMFRLPYKIRYLWEKHFMEEINKHHLEIFESENPDIVFIYNSEMLLLRTIQYFKRRSKIIFFLGDNPYYTPQNDYYISLLFYSNLVVSPDSFWAEQLKMLGVKNIIVDFPGYNEELYKGLEPTNEEKEKYKCDALFIGTGYTDAWGYKRALFLNHFVSFNLKAYGGRHFLKWFKFFPELEKKFIIKNTYISVEQMVKMHKSAKIYPVDANPAILNGVHLRVFDCIAMDILPVVEYRKDIEYFFADFELPLIRNYNEIEKVAYKWINNDFKRKEKLNELKKYTHAKYNPKIVVKRILNNVF